MNLCYEEAGKVLALQTYKLKREKLKDHELKMMMMMRDVNTKTEGIFRINTYESNIPALQRTTCKRNITSQRNLHWLFC